MIKALLSRGKDGSSDALRPVHIAELNWLFDRFGSVLSRRCGPAFRHRWVVGVGCNVDRCDPWNHWEFWHCLLQKWYGEQAGFVI